VLRGTGRSLSGFLHPALNAARAAPVTPCTPLSHLCAPMCLLLCSFFDEAHRSTHFLEFTAIEDAAPQADVEDQFS